MRPGSCLTTFWRALWNASLCGAAPCAHHSDVARCHSGHVPLTTLIPGDPALIRLGNFATAEQLQHLRKEMGLDKPSYERYSST